MTESIIEEFLLTRKTRENCALVTVASIKGSVPREPGSKMIVYSDRKISGTIGGGKFESLVIEESLIKLSMNLRFDLSVKFLFC